MLILKLMWKQSKHNMMHVRLSRAFRTCLGRKVKWSSHKKWPNVWKLLWQERVLKYVIIQISFFSSFFFSFFSDKNNLPGACFHLSLYSTSVCFLQSLCCCNSGWLKFSICRSPRTCLFRGWDLHKTIHLCEAIPSHQPSLPFLDCLTGVLNSVVHPVLSQNGFNCCALIFDSTSALALLWYLN